MLSNQLRDICRKCKPTHMASNYHKQEGVIVPLEMGSMIWFLNLKYNERTNLPAGKDSIAVYRSL